VAKIETYPDALRLVSQFPSVDLHEIAAIAVRLKMLMDSGGMAGIDASEEACSVFDDLHAVVDNLLEASASGALVVNASKPVSLTRQKSFFGSFFSVSAGIPVDDALERASAMLATANGLANSAAEKLDHELLWALSYQIEMSKAVLDAAISGLNEEVNHG
jgi:hypothetical protein